MKNNSDNFVFWLNGYVELNGERPTEAQWSIIEEHLSLVFKKETINILETEFTKPSLDIKYC